MQSKLFTNLSRRGLMSAAMSVALAYAPLSAGAADSPYPAKTITIVVPYAPGGQGDVLARMFAQRITGTLKQPAIVENKAGASGTIGTRYVVRSKPDGYTLLLGQTPEVAINGHVVKDLGYDPVKDLRPIALVGDSPLVLVASANAPFNSLQELLAQAKAKPGTLNYASPGNATPGHLAGAAMALGSKTSMVHVPYKGTGAAVTDILAGHIDVLFSSAAAAAPHLKGGRMKAIAVSTPKRIPAMPHVPAVAEAAVPGFSFTLWGGLFAPAGTPDEIVKLLNKEVTAFLSDPAVRSRLEGDGVIVRTNTPEEFAGFVKQEGIKYERLVNEIGVKAD
jgi:tripartite-type tricarboxylate transporter receptor subunit TctC